MSDLLKRAATLREQSAKALADARTLRDEFSSATGDVPADKMEQFRRAVDDSTALLEQAQVIETQASQLAKLEEAHTRPVTGLPTAGQREASGAADPRRAEAHKAAWQGFLQGNREATRDALLAGGYSSAEAHALIAGDDSKGGFLVPADFKAQVIERRAGIAVMRSLCQVVPTSRDTVEFPRIAANTGSYASSYQSGFAGSWDTEQGSTTETGGSVTVKTQQNQPTSEMVRIPVNNWIPNPVLASMSLLDDSAAPVETILARHIASTAALDEDYVTITGNGVSQPMGILSESSGVISQVITGSATAVTYAGLLDLIYGLPAQYAQGATLLMKRSTMGDIIALETGTNVDLVFKNTQIGPDNLLGYPVRFSDFVPAVGAGNLAIIFGNFSDGYVIADRQDLRVKRLEERYYPNIGFAPTMRIGGKVVLPEAFRIQKVAAS
jgi:HK97 family phage major capsid protein